jgi:hypothetical protein
MSVTPAAELVAVLYQTLTPGEQEDAFQKIKELRLRQLAGTEAEIGRFIRGLALVQEQVDGELSVDDYRAWYPKLQKRGHDVPPLSQVTKHFGSWRRAKEALLLSEDETALKIEARFRSRRVGKVHRYREETLGETLKRCAEFVGHAPLVVEFEAWRFREIELAKARGEEIALPSDSPYRTRYGTWEKALLNFGFSKADIDGAREATEAEATERLRKLHREGRVVYLTGSESNADKA